MSDARSAPLYCPYCGEEDLRPNEASHGAWECHSCARVFTVKFNGLLAASLKPMESGKADVEGVNR
jgi:transposase-like protein